MKKNSENTGAAAARGFTYLTNHSHVLVALQGTPDLRVRDLASLVGITERAVQRILSDLGEAGVVSVEKLGRRNRYRIARAARLRHPLEEHRSVGSMLDWVNVRSRGK